MYLKRIDLHGFKSFADKTVLTFDRGITAVVGPNGSGKSNVAEAVRWALGEQSARLLRGQSMTDVIFSGTEKRRPVGLAEVSLTLDNSDGALPLEFSEVTVTRRVDRSGEGEYLINGVPCRLRDIHELFADTGLGREGYFVVGQGRIDEVLSSRPEDRRGIFEEASGIVRYKLRKKEAERKLDETEHALERLTDLTDELRRQADHLSEQAARARRYLEVQRQLRRLDVVHLVQEARQLEDTVKQKQQERHDAETALAGIAATIAQAEAAQEQERLRLADVEEELGRLQAQLLELTHERSELQGRLELARERRGTQAQAREQAIASAREATEKLARLAAELDELAARQQQLMAGAAQLDADIAAAEAAAEADAAQLENRQASVARTQERLVELARRIADRESWLGSDQKGRSEAEQRLAALKTERDEALAARAEVDRELAALKDVLEGLDERQQALSERLAAAQAEHERLAAEQERIAALESRRREQLTALQSRARLLEEMHREGEGYQQGVRRLLQAAARDAALGDGLLGVVAELIRVPAAYELAIETALGGGLQNIVTETAAAAERAINWLKEHGAGRVTFLPLQTLQPRLPRTDDWQGLDAPGVIGPALDLIEYDKKLFPAVAFLLGRTVVCKDMRAALALGRKSRFAFRIVTLEGELVNPGGSLTGGRVGKGQQGGLLSRQRERQEAGTRLQALQAEIDRLAESRADTAAARQRLEAELADVRAELHRLEVERVQRDKDRTRYFDERARYDELATRLELQEMELGAQLSGGQRLAEQWEQELLRLRAENAALEAELAAETEAVRQGQAALVAERDRITALKVERAGLAEQLAAARQEQERLEEAVQETEDVRRLHEAAAARLADEIAQHEAEAHRLEQLVAEKAGTLAELEKALAAGGHGRQQLAAATAAREQELRELRREQAAVRDRQAAAERDETRAAARLDHIVMRLQDAYNLDLAGAAAEAAEADADTIAEATGPDVARQLTLLRSELAALEPVNLGAIQEHTEVAERLGFLAQQQADLEEAQTSLRQAIAELDERIAGRFAETFAQVRENFQATFTQFFGGGRADLQLADPDDLLNTGIEIVAQPPGKKLQSLSLLSGGERALTAIALLFAVLRFKPAPFVVLDEIEAALDEANVARFGNALREFGEETQFIVITHQKGTMAAADVLYGVTMAERGVSRLVSVRLAADGEPVVSGQAS